MGTLRVPDSSCRLRNGPVSPHEHWHQIRVPPLWSLAQMLAFPLREVCLFAKVAISDPVNANPVTGHQESFSCVCTSVSGILSTSWRCPRPMTKQKYSLHCMRICLWLTKLEKGEGRVNGGRKFEEILINMKTPYPRFTDTFQLLDWAAGLAQSSLPSPPPTLLFSQ